MKTKRQLTWISLTAIMVLLSTLASGCIPGWGIEGDGNVVKEDRSIDSFDRIQVSGAFEVYLTQGNTESLTLESDENLMEYIKTEVVNGKLKIYTDKDVRKFKEMNVYLTFKDLEKMDLSGAVEVSSENRLNLKDFEIDASGAVELNLSIKADYIEGDFSGATEIDLSGYSGEVNFDISGAAEVNAFDMETEVFKLDVSGASEAKVFVTKELHVDASGASSVRYKGEPKVYKDASGASSIKPY